MTRMIGACPMHAERTAGCAACQNRGIRYGGTAIHVRYLGQTYARGSRFVATADYEVGRAVVSYDYQYEGMRSAVAAARELLRRNGLPEWASLLGASMPDGSYVFIRDGAE